MPVDDFKITDAIPREQYIATPGQTDFVIPFRFFQGEDIEVYIDTSEDPEDANTYSVTGDGLNSNGTLAFNVGLTGGELVTIVRNSQIERVVNFLNSGDWKASNVNDQLNRLTTFIQEVALKALDLAVTLPITSQLSAVTFPDQGAATNANKLIVWNPAGTNLTNGPTITDILAVAEHIDEIDDLANIIPQIEVVAAIDDEVVGVYDIRTSVVNVSNNMPAIQNLDANMSAVQNLDVNMSDINNLTAAIPTIQQNADDAGNSAGAAFVSETNAGNSAGAAFVSETNAGNHELKAQQWSENPEDVPVEAGQFSALHWAKKAQASASGNGVALSILGNPTNSVTARTDIAAASDGQVLRRSGTTIGFGTIASMGIANQAVTYAKIQNVATQTFLGRIASGTGSVTALTKNQVVTALDALVKDEPVLAQNAAGAYDIDFDAAQAWKTTLTANATFSIINPPSGAGMISQQIVQGSGGYTPSWSITNFKWCGGVAPTMPSTAGDSLFIVYVTFDGGSTWTGFVAGEREA